MRFYIIFLTMLSISACFTGCGGGGGGHSEGDSYINRVIAVVPSYVSSVTWESWVMGAVLEGNDEKDYSFMANCVIKRNGGEIYGFGNANGYPLGNFVIKGIRTGDNIEFEILSQNRYRAFKLTGRGIYINVNAKIGGNRLEGGDFWTAFDDPIDYTGNFEVVVKVIAPPEENAEFTGQLDGAYNSIENGEIVLKTNDDSTILNIQSFSGGFVGANQSEGVFNVDNTSVFGDIPITSFSFSKVVVIGGYTVEIDGAISDAVASGFVIIQYAGRTYIGAFTALSE